MEQSNQHKFHAKSACMTSVIPRHNEQSQPVNYSRTLGQSKNWIGSGYINKSGVDIDHIDVTFPFYSLVYVVQGKGTYIDDKGIHHQLNKGCVFQRRPDMIHSTKIEPKSDWKEYYLDCNKELYQHLSSVSLIDKSISVYYNKLNSSITDDIESLMSALQTCNEESLFDAYLQYLAILRSLLNWKREPDALCEMVEQSCGDFDHRYALRFDLKQYCKGNGWGYEKFRKSFKRSMGISPREYLIRKRMDEACRLLRSTPKRISEIASELGYASQYEFSNQFKKTFHVFPKHYRDGI